MWKASDATNSDASCSCRNAMFDMCWLRSILLFQRVRNKQIDCGCSRVASVELRALSLPFISSLLNFVIVVLLIGLLLPCKSTTPPESITAYRKHLPASSFVRSMRRSTPSRKNFLCISLLQQMNTTRKEPCNSTCHVLPSVSVILRRFTDTGAWLSAHWHYDNMTVLWLDGVSAIVRACCVVHTDLNYCLEINESISDR